MKHLKIAEQIILVLVIAVIIPLGIASAIITNVNQHAVRNELQKTANYTAENLYYRLDSILRLKNENIQNIATSIKNLKEYSQKKQALKSLSETSDSIKNIEFVRAKLLKNNNDFFCQKEENNDISIYSKYNNYYYLKETLDLKQLEDELFLGFNKEKREVYITDFNKNLILSHNYKEEHFNQILSIFPKPKKTGKSQIFAKVKNQPNSIIRHDNPDLYIVVTTPESYMLYSIIKARYKIILAIFLGGLMIIFLCALYTFSLYTNIRQLFKAIDAIAAGNYRRKIRLITNVFTPHETIYISKAFNKMVTQVRNSYGELEKISKLKSNLIDTVSHELRTPLTSIKGYTSRLLRTDIEIDEETRIKSLKVIKKQTERLSRMVDDLLVIPEIENSYLKVEEQDVDVLEAMENSILIVSNAHRIELECSAQNTVIIADKDKLEQVFINLFENAIKYSTPETAIKASIKSSVRNVRIKFSNQADIKDKKGLNNLFEKFTRLDEETTRTTRGTGLGLYIVKGLVNTMGGEIKISYDNTFNIEIKFPLKQDDE